jgi:hypothetical protein
MTYAATAAKYRNYPPNQSGYTRYIAPLMTDLNPSARPESAVYYYVQTSRMSSSISSAALVLSH